MRVHGMIKWLFQHCLGVGQGIFLSNYHLEICCILEETNLKRNLKIHGPKINRSREAAKGPRGGANQGNQDQTLVHDVNCFSRYEKMHTFWAHKSLYLKTSGSFGLDPTQMHVK